MKILDTNRNNPSRQKGKYHIIEQVYKNYKYILKNDIKIDSVTRDNAYQVLKQIYKTLPKITIDEQDISLFNFIKRDIELNIKYSSTPHREKLTINDLWWMDEDFLNTDEYIEYSEKDVHDIEELYNLSIMDENELLEYNQSVMDDRDLSMAEIRLHQKQVDETNKKDISNVAELDPFIL